MDWLLAFDHLLYLVAITTACLMGMGMLLSVDEYFGVDASAMPDDTALDMVPFDASPSRRLVFRALSALGYGRAPVSLILFTSFLGFGVAGIVSTTWFEQADVARWFYAPLSFCLAVTTGLVVAAVFGQAFFRFMPRTETASVRNDDLRGCTGPVILDEDELSPAVVQIRDAFGALQQIQARGLSRMLVRGDEIVIVDHDEATSLFRADPVG